MGSKDRLSVHQPHRDPASVCRPSLTDEQEQEDELTPQHTLFLVKLEGYLQVSTSATLGLHCRCPTPGRG